jgi:MFS family permease
MSRADVAFADELSPDLIPPRPLRHHLALTVYWLSNTLLWGALLHLGIQSRLSDWFGETEKGYRFALIGLVGGIVGTAAQIVIGAFSDRSLCRWGRRRVFVALGTTLAVGALLLLGAAKSFWPFLGALILLQLFTNTALAPFTALLPDTVNPREHGKASGFMGVARFLGDTGGQILSGLLLHAGIRTGAEKLAFHDARIFVMCAIMAAFMLFTTLVTCVTIKEHRLRRRPEATTWQIIIGSFAVDITGNVDFFWLSLSRAVTNVGFYMFLAVMPFFVADSLGIAAFEHATMLLMLPGIAAAAISSVLTGAVSDRIGRRRLIFVAQFIMAGSALGFALTPNLKVAYAAVIPGGMAYGIFTAVEWALACNLLPAGEAGRYLGVWNASAVVPQIIGISGGGALGSEMAKRHPGVGLGWRVDFVVVLVCCLVGAYFLKFVRERRYAPAPAEPQPAPEVGGSVASNHER